MAECLDQRQARDLPRLAWEGFSVALAMEIEASRQATIARRGTETDPENGSGESDVGRGADCRRIAPQTTHSRLASDGPTLHASRHWTEETRSFSTLDDLRTKSCPGHSGLRILHLADRFLSSSLRVLSPANWNPPDRPLLLHRQPHNNLYP